MTAVSAIRLADGTDVLAADATCEGCGNSMADHNCGTTGGGSVTLTSSRSMGPRKPVTAHPTCPHCGGRVHFNMSGTAINAECINRQYSLYKGIIASPNDHLPVMTLETMKEILDWVITLSTPITYGKMVSASGGAGTYSGLRPKTGRKKVVAAAPGAQIQDMADGESVEGATSPAVKAKKPRKSRKNAAATVVADEMSELEASAVADVTDDGDEMLLDEVSDSDESDDAVEVAEEIMASAPVVDEEADPESAETLENGAVDPREARAERRRARKALLAGKV